MNADLIVLGPGGLHTALIPNLLVEGVSKALQETKAKKILVINLMNRKGQTDNFKSGDYLREVARFIGKDIFDYILVNSSMPSSELIEIYARESEVVENNISDPRVIAADLLDNRKSEYGKSDILALNRALIRHDSQKLASELMKIVNHL
jgi:uncharacterized cofD-like protein